MAYSRLLYIFTTILTYSQLISYLKNAVVIAVFTLYNVIKNIFFTNMKVVAQKAVHHAKKHKFKIIIGTPIIFALFVNVDIADSQNILSLTTKETPYVEVGETIPLDITMESYSDVNAVGSTVAFDEESFSFVSAITEDSAIDLWAQEPAFLEGELIFAGGITSSTTCNGEKNILSFNITPLKEGVHTLSFNNPEILANDGKGTNILTEKRDATLYVRSAGLPSPDVNDDGKVSLMDINIVYFNSLRKDNPRYDLNGDGEVTLGDVRVILNLL